MEQTGITSEMTNTAILSEEETEENLALVITDDSDTPFDKLTSLLYEAGRHAAEDADDEDSCEEDNTLHEDCTNVQASYGSELENDDDGDGVDDKGDNPVKDAADIEENRVAEDMATAKGHEKSDGSDDTILYFETGQLNQTFTMQPNKCPLPHTFIRKSPVSSVTGYDAIEPSCRNARERQHYSSKKHDKQWLSRRRETWRKAQKSYRNRRLSKKIADVGKAEKELLKDPLDVEREFTTTLISLLKSTEAGRHPPGLPRYGERRLEQLGDPRPTKSLYADDDLESVELTESLCGGQPRAVDSDFSTDSMCIREMPDFVKDDYDAVFDKYDNGPRLMDELTCEEFRVLASTVKFSDRDNIDNCNELVNFGQRSEGEILHSALKKCSECFAESDSDST